jgi:hypothetical protein
LWGKVDVWSGAANLLPCPFGQGTYGVSGIPTTLRQRGGTSGCTMYAVCCDALSGCCVTFGECRGFVFGQCDVVIDECVFGGDKAAFLATS